MKIAIRNFAFFALALLVASRCATEQGTGTSISGSAVFRYATGDFDVLISVQDRKIYAAGILFGIDDSGQRVQASEIEEGTTITWPESIDFTLPDCSSDPVLESTDIYPTYRIFNYVYPSTCTPPTTASISGEAHLIVHRADEADRIINGVGSGGGGAQLAEHVIFTTSATYPGNLGGLDGADILCDGLADSGSVTSALGGTWKAILSDSTTSASSRINLTPGASIKNAGGQQVATASTLWGGTLLGGLLFSEAGVLVNTDYVWTGSEGNGTPTLSGDFCADWTSGAHAQSGGEGDFNQSNSLWLDTGQERCNESLRLYCINSN